MSLSLSNGDISLLILLGVAFIYISNYFVVGLKKYYEKYSNAFFSINTNLQQINDVLHNSFMSNQYDLSEINNNSKNINKKMDFISTLYTIKYYCDIIVPLINSKELESSISKIICYGIDNLFCKNNKNNIINTDTKWCDISTQNTDTEIKKNNDNIKNHCDTGDNKTNVNNTNEMNSETKNNINKNTNTNDVIENSILKNIINSATSNNNIQNAHPKLYLGNNLTNSNECNKNLQNKFNEYIYNTDKLKNNTIDNYKNNNNKNKLDNDSNNKILNDDSSHENNLHETNIVESIHPFHKNNLHEISNMESIHPFHNKNNTQKTNVVGLNDGNMSYAPFN